MSRTKRRKTVKIMKSKISLDFTSLLDITMIILFFFLINFKFSVDDIKAEADSQMEAAAAQSERLEADKQEFEKEKAEWQRTADAELENIREADKKAADNVEALINFKNGDVIDIALDIKERFEWEMTFSRGTAVMGTISSDDDKAVRDWVVTMLNHEGFKSDDVIVGVFKYNKNNYGSRFAEELYNEARDADYIFKNFYLANSPYVE